MHTSRVHSPTRQKPHQANEADIAHVRRWRVSRVCLEMNILLLRAYSSAMSSHSTSKSGPEVAENEL